MTLNLQHGESVIPLETAPRSVECKHQGSRNEKADPKGIGYACVRDAVNFSFSNYDGPSRTQQQKCLLLPASFEKYTII